MKTLYFTIAISLFTAFQLNAQRSTEIKNSEVKGIYLSLADFQANKLTIPTDKLHKGDKINLKQFFYSSYIISIEHDKETVFYKDSIFAIQLASGENYRFINRTPCLIADTSYLYIYTNKTIKTEYKQSGPRRIAKEIPVTYYYFSIGNHKPVLSLTMANLRKYALTDTLVHKAVCDKFTTDEMLTTVNPQTGRFVVNETIISIMQK